MSGIVALLCDQPVTTTSAIADGTGVDHASVIKLVRTYRTDLEEFGRVGFEIQPFQTPGGPQEREIACLNEQQATLLMTYMRNSDTVREFKKRLVKAFWDMSRQVMSMSPSPANLSRLQLIEMAMQAEQERLVIEQQNTALEHQVESLTPKAQALDRIATSDGSFCLMDAAKALQVQPRKFNTKLQEMGWIHRRPMGSGWLAYQIKIAQGLLEHKVTTGERSDGGEWTSTQVRVTAKGMARLAEIFTKEEMAVMHDATKGEAPVLAGAEASV